MLESVLGRLSGARAGWLLWVAVIMAGASGAALAAAPTVDSGSATSVGSGTATVAGSVNANGLTTSAYFEYGLSTSYGFTWPGTPSTVTGSTDTPVSATLEELLPNTTYHYRLVAINSGGTTYGADTTFVTSQLPPGAVTTAASSVGTNQAVLNGVVEPRGASTSVTFEYGIDTNYGTSIAASPSTVSTYTAVNATVTGLSDATTYHFRVVAQNANGTTYGSDLTFTTGGAPAPSATTSAATGVGSGSATVNGIVNANNDSTSVTFEYGLDTGYGSSVAAAPSPVSGTSNTAVSAPLYDLVPATTYHYRVRATNSGGTTNGLDMTFTTRPEAPAAVTGAASVVTTAGATLNGTVNAKGVSTSVSFEYGLDTSYGTTVSADGSPLSTSTDTVLSKSISGLSNGVTYHYRIVATNSGGTTYGANMTFTTGASPPAAATAPADSIGTTAATLHGTANANGSNTTIWFEIGTSVGYGRAVDAAPSPLSDAGNTSVSAGVTGLAPGTFYHFRVVAQNANGIAYGADMTFTTQAAPSATTDAPSAVSSTGATLNGTVNAFNAAAAVTFEYGTTTAYGATVAADESPVSGAVATAVHKSVTGLVDGTVYRYRVVAQNANGTTYGADRSFVANTGGAPTVTTTAASSISMAGATLNGLVTANNAVTTVTFEYGGTVAYGSTVAAAQSPVDGPEVGVSVVLSGLAFGTTYHYRVVGANAHGTTNGADMTFATNPVAASMPSATTLAASGVTSTAATVSGLASARNERFTASVTFEYGETNAYGNSVNANPASVFGLADTNVSQILTGLTPNTTYHYRVKATEGGNVATGDDMTFTTGASQTATTNAATAIAANAATLNGTVNAGGLSSTVYFEYGLSSGYGKTAMAAQSPVAGSSNVDVSAAVSDLSPSATYHYRVVIQGPAETTYGADLVFSTDAAPPAVVTQEADSVTDTAASLNGAVNANNDLTSASFEYGTTTAYGSTVSATPSSLTGTESTSVSADLSGLSPGTAYHFRVVGQSASGTSYGADKSFTTAGGPPVAPAASTGAASDFGADSATLNGVVNANGTATTVSFEFGATTAYGKTVSAVQSPLSGNLDTPVSVSLNGLVAGTTYHYRVTATNVAGTTNGTDAIFVAGLPNVTTSDASNLNGTGATLNGSANANSTVTAVSFQYGNTTAYGSSLAGVPATVTGTANTGVAADLGGLVPNTTYHFRLVGQSVRGSGFGADKSFTTPKVVPSAATTNPAGVNGSGATLNGSVNANNDATSVVFEYGTDTHYGSQIAASPASLSGTTTTNVSAVLGGLLPNVTYHYRVVAQNGAGAVQGGDKTFTTSKVLPSVSSGGASGIGATAAVLGGTVNANNDSTSVSFEYGTSLSYGSVTAGVPATVSGMTGQPVTVSLTGLSPNTTYHYRAVAQNGAGTAHGADRTFTTAKAAPTASTVAASAIDASAATLNGSVNAQNDATSVSFEYGTDTHYGSSTAAAPSPLNGAAATAVSAALTGLLPNTTYHYRVVAQNGAGTVRGADLSFTTAKRLPAVSTNGASGVGDTAAVLNATIRANNDSTTATFEYGTTSAYGSVVSAVPGTVTGMSDTAVSSSLTSLLPNTTYHYRAVGQNGAGTAQGSDITFTTGKLAPTVSTAPATGVAASAANLHGSVNAQNDSAMVYFEYGTDVSYGASATATPSPVTGASDTPVSVALSGLQANTTYHYRVVAQNSSGTSTGVDMTFTTAGVKPVVATQAATGVGPVGATLNGTVNANNDNAAASFEYGLDTGYGNTAAATPTPVTGNADTSVTATLSNLAPNTTYHYRLIGSNAVGTSVGADLTFTTAPAKPTVTTSAAMAIAGGAATLTGIVNANNDSTSVSFEYGLDVTYGMTVAASPTPVSGSADVAVSAVLSNLLPNTIYHYRVVGANANGSSVGGDMTFNTSPVQPTATTEAASGVGADTATLNGVVNANNDSTTVSFEYGIDASYGSTTTASPTPVVGGVNTPVNAVLTGLAPNTTYHYRVVAGNSGGASAGTDMTFTTAAIKPSATTREATDVGLDTANLHGIVNAQNDAASVSFEYGTDTSYGTSVSALPSPVVGSADVAVSAALVGLAPNTRYHYRVVAQNGTGTAYGGDQTFSTTVGSPRIVSTPAPVFGPEGIILLGVVNPANLETRVFFEFGASGAASLGESAVRTQADVPFRVEADQSPVSGAQDVTVTTVVTHFSPGSTIVYRVVAENAVDVTYGPTQTVQVPGATHAIPLLGPLAGVLAFGLMMVGIRGLRRAPA